MNTFMPNSEQLAVMRTPHLGRLLLRATRAFNTQALQRMHQRGYTALTLSHTALLPHLDPAGTRLTLLAERMNVTKQSAFQFIEDLERQSYVERLPDPADKRAVLVRFTPAGWQLCLEASDVLREVEADFATRLGDDDMHLLLNVLELIAQDPA